MKKTKLVLTFFILGLFVLAGCSTEEATPSFILQELMSVQWDDEETPVTYIVNPDEARDKILIYRNEMISETIFDRREETYDLDAVTVTDDEIVIEYDGKTEKFERLSSSVAQNEERQQYQYSGLSEE